MRRMRLRHLHLHRHLLLLLLTFRVCLGVFLPFSSRFSNCHLWQSLGTGENPVEAREDEELEWCESQLHALWIPAQEEEEEISEKETSVENKQNFTEKTQPREKKKRERERETSGDVPSLFFAPIPVSVVVVRICSVVYVVPISSRAHPSICASSSSSAGTSLNIN